MDVTIPPHNLKRFTSSITCLGRIGKDLYVSFDPLDGLTLSSLNEAKSAYGKFHFDPGFFTTCDGQHNNNKNNNDDDHNDRESKYICRVPIRSVSSVLHTRKNVLSLRLKSEGADDHGNLFGMRQARKKASEDESRGRGKRMNGGGNTTRRNRNDVDDVDDVDDDDNEDQDEDNEGRGRRRRRGGSLSARERSRSRNARRREMRSRSAEADDENENENESSSKRNVDKMMLSFEYHIEILRKFDTASNTGAYPNNNSSNNSSSINGGGRYSVVHRVGVTDANGISLSTSIARRRTRSEIVSHPRLFLRLLDPLRRTAEVALTVDDTLKVVTATSFHPNEMGGGGGGGSNTILQANLARNAVLKTETSTGAEEFDEYDFRSNRGKKMKKKAKQVSPDEGGRHGDDDDDDDVDCENEGDDAPPLDVNQKVILVFSIKEAKAMMQYCAHTYNLSSYHDDDDDDGVVLSFHWGGRPIVIETAGDYFTAELVLATLHHGMIASNITVGGGGE